VAKEANQDFYAYRTDQATGFEVPINRDALCRCYCFGSLLHL